MPTREDAYWIFVRSSFAGYLTAWLQDDMAKCGMLLSAGTLR